LARTSNNIGKSELKAIHASGVARKQVGLIIDGDPLTGPNTTFWPVLVDGKTAGKVTSAVYSPRLKKNIAMAMLSTESLGSGLALSVDTSAEVRNATLTEIPFYDPKKQITSASL
jgi:glycine cleavage system aminomethyltransferase T